MLALATCADLPAEADESALEAALAAAGVDHEWVVWDDEGRDWSVYDAVLIRTTWDYHERVGAFVGWAQRVGAVSRLWNPPDVVAWNSHKGYLLDLAADGVAVVPTELVPGSVPGRRADSAGAGALADIAARRGWVDVVVKPAVSVGAIGAHRGRVGDPALDAAMDALVAGGADALVQPFLVAVTEVGETSTVFVEGRPTHAVRKVPVSGDYRSQPEHGGRLRRVEPTAAQLAVGEAALAAVARRLGPVLYARVDTIDLDGEPHLIELELMEPDLFWPSAPEAATVLVEAILRRLASGAGTT